MLVGKGFYKKRTVWIRVVTFYIYIHICLDPVGFPPSVAKAGPRGSDRCLPPLSLPNQLV